MIEKIKIQDLVKVFYQQPFKIFYINSQDGENFMTPTGLFISLGITTPKIVLEGLCNIILSTYPESNARIVELVSKDRGNHMFLNRISDKINPDPYLMDSFPTDTMDYEKSTELLKQLRQEANQLDQPNIKLLSSIQKLNELIGKLSTMDNGWENHRIVKTNNDDSFRLYHRIVNYIKKDGVEYRIGICVE